MRPFETESAMFEAFAPYLVDMGYEVFPEVSVPGRPGAPNETRADLVAVMGNQAWVFCGKLNGGVSVLAQAHSYRPNAQRVSVVVPVLLSPRVEALYDALGIGLLHILPSGHVATRVDARVRAPVDPIIAYLHGVKPLGADGAPSPGEQGGASNKPKTEFQATRDRLVEYVRGRPRCWVRELVTCVPHHWSSHEIAERRVIQLVRDGAIPLIRHGGSGKVRFSVPDED